MNTDWKLLRKQKETLFNVIAEVSEAEQEHLTGILHLIDAIQDAAADDPAIGAEMVFGPLYRLTLEQETAVQQLKTAGWAVAVFNPRELKGEDPETVQFYMTQAVNQKLQHKLQYKHLTETP